MDFMGIDSTIVRYHLPLAQAGCVPSAIPLKQKKYGLVRVLDASEDFGNCRHVGKRQRICVLGIGDSLPFFSSLLSDFPLMAWIGFQPAVKQ
jgi:hypothetical protein